MKAASGIEWRMGPPEGIGRCRPHRKAAFNQGLSAGPKGLTDRYLRRARYTMETYDGGYGVDVGTR